MQKQYHTITTAVSISTYIVISSHDKELVLLPLSLELWLDKSRRHERSSRCFLAMRNHILVIVAKVNNLALTSGSSSRVEGSSFSHSLQHSIKVKVKFRDLVLESVE